MSSIMKYSKVEKLTNTYIWVIMIIQALICLGAGIFQGIWYDLYRDTAPYLDFIVQQEFFSRMIISFGQWFLIMM